MGRITFLRLPSSKLSKYRLFDRLIFEQADLRAECEYRGGISLGIRIQMVTRGYGLIAARNGCKSESQLQTPAFGHFRPSLMQGADFGTYSRELFPSDGGHGPAQVGEGLPH
jgi:hypothetical protein